MKICQKYSILSFILVSFFFFSGCKRNVQNKIVGEWELQFFEKDKAPYTSGYVSTVGGPMKIEKILFSFEDGDKMTTTTSLRKPNGGDSAFTDIGYYYIQRPKTQVQVKITKLPLYQGISLNGVWFIDKLDSQVLMLQKVQNEDLSGGPYLRFEFLKK